MITYFISYRFVDGNEHGAGRCAYDTSEPISGIEQIAEIESIIKEKNNLTKAIIVNWKRFENKERDCDE